MTREPIFTAIENWIRNENVSYFDIRRSIRGDAKLPPVASKGAILPPSPASSVALVVTFNPDESILKNIALLRTAFSEVLIVDNSISSKKEWLLANLPGFSAASILHNGNHNGLAGALNLGVRTLLSASNPKEWLFFFDQDTELKTNYFPELSDALKNQSGEQLSNSIYVVEYDDRLPETPKELLRDFVQEVSTAITSGSFLRTESIHRIGLYIDEMFIDSLDHDFCMRAQRFGFKIRLVRKKLIYHDLGELSVHYLFGKRFRVHNHPPFRWYFFIRNYIFSCAENFPASFWWTRHYGKVILKTYLKALLFEKNKWRKSRAAFLGALDGFLLVFAFHKKRKISSF